jgi:hypothetical protein
MIPEFIDIGAAWKVLPPGVHDASLEEVRERFATNETRSRLFEGFIKACQSLANAGCKVLYLDGSYVTEKRNPGDYDVCWDLSGGVDESKVDPVFFDFSYARKYQKRKYSGEFFPSSFLADGVMTFAEYFRVDKETGLKKGIIRIHL